MASSSSRTIVVGVTGCIAAYKACELVRGLMRLGYKVKVVMTDSATRFVAPLTFRTLTRQPVAVSLWEEPAQAPVHHVSLAQEASVMVIAPCTANVIAKLACGRADDLLTTTALATEAPIVIAPAMNDHMWQNDVTQANVETLTGRGAVIVRPGTGELACGDVGEGRLAEVDDILAAVLEEARRSSSLAGRHLLVTAGGTQEPIDPVRFLGNHSSGKTGYAIAEEAARRGAEVTLISGPTALRDPFGVKCVRVTTALEMHREVRKRCGDAEAVVMTAAVADFRPAEPAEHKVKKTQAPGAVQLLRNPDILAELGSEKGNRVLVGFAAETRDVVPEARMKLAAKKLDLVVANDVSVPGLGFGSDSNRVWLVDEHGEQELPVMSKRRLAGVLLDRVAGLLAGRNGR